MRNLTYDVALSIRQAQTYGISVRKFTPSGGSGQFAQGYGVSFQLPSPTTYLIFADANANGHYIKHANGVLECWSNNIGSVGCTVASGVAFTSGDVSWTFPAVFIDIPVFIPTSDGASNRWATPSGATGTTGTARVLSLVSSATALPVKGYAKGRWR